MNTLLIAPESDLLRLPDEARHIQEALGAQTINGRVTPMLVADAISNRIARRQAIDIFFFIGHGNLTGLALSDGYITIAELCRYVKSANIRYLILNTCESEYIALAIHHETNATVICTIGQVADTQAYATSRLLAEAIAQGYSVEDAYERARPSGAGPSPYRIFSQIDDARIDQDHQTIKLLRAVLDDQFRRNQTSIGELKATIETFTDYVVDLIQDVAELKKAQAETVTLPTNYKIVYTLAFLAIFVPVGVFFSDFRQALGINAPLAYAFSFLFYTISYSLFAYLYGFIANRSKKP